MADPIIDRRFHFSHYYLSRQRMNINNFQIVGKLGRGGYGTVILAKANNKISMIEKEQIIMINVISKKFKNL